MLTNLKGPRLTLAVALGLLAIAGPASAGTGAGDLPSSDESLRADKNEISIETLELGRPGQPRGIDVWETAGLRV